MTVNTRWCGSMKATDARPSSRPSGTCKGVVDMEDDEARSLLREIHEHQVDDAVATGTAGNRTWRSLGQPKCAAPGDGSCEGHDHLLRRTTIVR